ncbi:MAG: MASE1 domain-containing protein [Alphaproteobacteria bacterium]|nr:MASE1 domain-containing protein [Alphaproteobacteria bacterium]
MRVDTAQFLPWVLLRRLTFGAAYVVLHEALVAADLLDPVAYHFGPPWNPAVGLALALLLMGGVAYVPLVAFAAILANVQIRGFGLTLFSLGEGMAVAAIYGAAAKILLRHQWLDTRLSSFHDTVRLLSVAIGAAMVHALILLLFRHAGDGDVVNLFLRHCASDILGIVVVTPFLLLHGGEKLLPRPIFGNIVEAFSIIMVLWVDFGMHASEKFRFFYLLFVPLVWIAVRHGLKGATAGILLAQLGLMVAIQFVPFRDPSLTLLQLIMLTLSITALLLGALVSEQRRTSAALKAIVTMAPDGVMTIDEANVIETANSACEAMFGMRAAELVGKRLDAVLSVLGPAVLPFRGETKAVRHDGTTFPVDVAIGDIDLPNRRLAVVIIRDISLRKAMDTQLWEHQSNLANVARLSESEKLATVLAHQLNQPLSAVIGYTRASQRLLRGGLEPMETILTAMDKAVVQAERSGDIIRSIRDFLSNGSMNMAPITISGLFDESARVVAHAFEASEIALQFDCPASLPPVMADPLQVEQVLVNLLHNAREAITSADSKTRVVQISAKLTPMEPDFVEITVHDSGPGILPDIAENLFTPFTTSKASGMGMGLFIAMSIIEAHGGMMRVASASTTGASFYFTLPIATVAHDPTP